MIYKKIRESIYLRVDKNEWIIEAIESVCEKEHIMGGFFHGIGACDTAVLSTYMPEKKAFSDHTITGMIEMVSLMGNITTNAQGKPTLHCHAVFSQLDETGNIAVTAGHLNNARISYTGEIVLTSAGQKIGKIFDSKIGIDVWDLA